MAANTQQFYTRSEPMVRKVNEVGDFSHLEYRMGNMERMMQQIAAAVIPSYTEEVEQASAIYANKQAAVSTPFNQQGGYQFLQRPQQKAQGMSIDDKLNLILNTMTQDKQKTEMVIKDMQTQMGQLATTVSKLEAQAAGKLPSQPLNHRENVSAIELRSGKQVEKSETSPESHECDLEKEVDEAVPKKDDSVTNSKPKPLISTYVTPPPFPNRFAKSKKETLDKEIWEIFKKIGVNIPLIEAIRKVPHYAKFLKEFFTNKHKLTGNECGAECFDISSKETPT
ncbi:uncharacterized protein LOC113360348 [Papaver somniferum]|uniref:uncharacterized protein LOC113360348 n=1 Tax=Papaver somniferum TaxID=3469 RepID=UPI000E6F7607|nr:uncharacterized protein LOC113360348 [Papaver somniferum]